jgi:hypothetical protein
MLPRSPLHLVLTALLISMSGACTSLYKGPEFVERVDRIDQDQLEEMIVALEKIGPRATADSAATERTATWIRGQLEGYGYTVIEEEFDAPTGARTPVVLVRKKDSGPDGETLEIPLGSRSSKELESEGWEASGSYLKPVTVKALNLFAEIPGSELADEVIEVNAHYDTVSGSPGASDNSSGVAIVLEMARVLAGGAPSRTIRFCFFAAEESGLDGSRAHVERILQPDTPEVVALINLDSVGFYSEEPDSQKAPVRIPLVTWLPSTGNFIAVIGTFSTGWLGNIFEASADAYVPQLKYYSANRIGGFFKDALRSDHAPYWDAGIPALFLTNTANFRSKTYHRPEDTSEKMNFLFVSRVAQAATATVLELSTL